MTVTGLTLWKNIRYADYMTLSERNLTFKLGIILSLICLTVCILASIVVVPVYSTIDSDSIRRDLTGFTEKVLNSGILSRAFTGKFFGTELLAVHACILALVLYSFVSIIFIYYFFEKTQSPEILYVVFFAASFSLEALRLVLPLGWIFEIPSLYQLTISRIILFSRYFGIFSLFTASVFAAGFKAQNQRTVIMVIGVITLIITLGAPIDTEAWNSSLNMISGQVKMFRLIEAGTMLITAISFLIAGWSRSSRDFIYIGIGAVLAFLGRNILLNADMWAGLPTGLALLLAGTWLICTKLHNIYLWL